MTIAICLKVGDGVVLGTDSAGSLIGANNEYFNIYYSAEKTINLVKGLPVGMMTYGLGGLRGMSISTLARDLRDRLSGEDHAHRDWHLDRLTYTVQEVAGRVKEFFYDGMYVPEFSPPTGGAHDEAAADEFADSQEEDAETDPQGRPRVPRYPSLGFMIAGFSAGQPHAEVWTVEVGSDGQCDGPTQVYDQTEVGVVTWRGMPEALDRLLLGWSDEAMKRLLDAGVPPDVAAKMLISYSDLAHPAMPIQDAIDLVRYLADVSCGFVRFKAGPPTVAPPIDIAAITRHQPFRWIQRKHYYSSEFKPAFVDAPHHAPGGSHA